MGVAIALLAVIAAPQVLGQLSAQGPSDDASPAGAPAASRPATDPSTKHRYIGAAGCAAAVCHGGGGLVAGERNPRGSEYTYWLSRDPHARAFAILLGEDSERIVANLRASGRYGDLPAPSEATLCLTCHSISPGSYEGDPNPHGLQGGVSCEACHGSAEHWVEAHKRSDWKTRSASEKQALGFQNTQDIARRAQLCGSCHIGGRRGDINHDFLAAGHPRLTFEFSAYQANMPAHWDVAAEQRDVVGGAPRSQSELAVAYETKLWALGQVGTARQAVDLLQQRAAGGERTVWPEFSELHCFDCHHGLADEPAWGSSASAHPGVASWGTWSYPLLPVLSAETDGPDLTSEESRLARLEQALLRPYPDRAEVERLAAALSTQLEDWATRLRTREDWHEDGNRLLRAVAQAGPSLVERNWDAAAQTYLAVAALGAGRAAGGTDDAIGEAIRAATGTMHKALYFQSGEDTGTDAAAGDSRVRIRMMIDGLTRLQEPLGR